jgi:hypothetical protein
MLFLLVALAADVPAPSKLFETAMAASKAQAEKNWKFTYREDEIRASGRKTYDVIMLEGDNYRKLISVDQKPLDPKTRKKVDEDMEKARAARRKGAHHGFTRTYNGGELPDLLRLCDLKLTAEETTGGRKAWRVEAEPKPGLKASNQDDEETLASHHVVWFDEEEGMDIRRTDTFFRATNGAQPGMIFEVQMMKFGDAWVTDRFYLKYDVKFAPFIRVRGDVNYRFYDYKRFQVDSTFTPSPN